MAGIGDCPFCCFYYFRHWCNDFGLGSGIGRRIWSKPQFEFITGGLWGVRCSTMLAITNEHGGRRSQAKVYMQQQQTCCVHGSSLPQASHTLLRICEVWNKTLQRSCGYLPIEILNLPLEFFLLLWRIGACSATSTHHMLNNYLNHSVQLYLLLYRCK